MSKQKWNFDKPRPKTTKYFIVDTWVMAIVLLFLPALLAIIHGAGWIEELAILTGLVLVCFGIRWLKRRRDLRLWR